MKVNIVIQAQNQLINSALSGTYQAGRSGVSSARSFPI